MSARGIATFIAVVASVGCDRLLHRDAPDATHSAGVPPSAMIAPRDGGLSPAALASALAGEEEDEAFNASAPDAAPTCPLALHPDYCRRSCRNYISRSYSLHARRISDPARAGVGGCGPYKVFAEDEKTADGGVGRGLVEYFDGATNELVGAVDSRQHGCGKYGTIPTCKLEINWGPPHGFRGLGTPK